MQRQGIYGFSRTRVNVTIRMERKVILLCFSFAGNKIYGKCPKISNTKVSGKMSDVKSVDPDQTTPERAV